MLALVATVALAAPQSTIAPEGIISSVLADETAMVRLVELVDGIGARPAGSAAYRAAVVWAKTRFEADGLRVRLEPVKVTPWVRGVETAALVAATGTRPQPLVVTALGNSSPTPADGITAEVIEVRSIDELTADRVRGRIVFFNHAMRTAADYGRVAALRGRGPHAATKAGAVAVLIRSLATASLRSPHTGTTFVDDGSTIVPSAALAVEDAELLHRALGRGPVRVQLTLGCKHEAPVDDMNVIAEIRGREKPDEIVLLGAHLDSWDLSSSAQDDGTGVALVMQAARTLARLKVAPRRTVRFVLFADEEKGLVGARAYATVHAAELAKHVVALESDSGAGQPWGVRASPGGRAIIERLLRPLERINAGVFDEEEAEGSDISALAGAKVPIVSIAHDVSHYFDIHHSAADTIDKVDPAAYAKLIAAFTWMTYALADEPQLLPR